MLEPQAQNPSGLQIRRLFEGFLFFGGLMTMFGFLIAAIWLATGFLENSQFVNPQVRNQEYLLITACLVGFLLAGLVVMLVQFSQDMMTFRVELMRMERLQRKIARESGLLSRPQNASGISLQSASMISKHRTE